MFARVLHGRVILVKTINGIANAFAKVKAKIATVAQNAAMALFGGVSSYAAA